MALYFTPISITCGFGVIPCGTSYQEWLLRPSFDNAKKFRFWSLLTDFDAHSSHRLLTIRCLFSSRFFPLSIPCAYRIGVCLVVFDLPQFEPHLSLPPRYSEII